MSEWLPVGAFFVGCIVGAAISDIAFIVTIRMRRRM